MSFSIIRKNAFARAEHCDEDGVDWIAEARANTGVWVIRDRDGEDDLARLCGRCAWMKLPPNADGAYPMPIVGAMFPFTEEAYDTMLFMTPEQRTALGMSDATYQTLNVKLHISRQEGK